jgi:hypothetical protein|uniref:Uncharacterized protein n=1 Tax=Siphoviridae sp. ctt5z12 TaxID=2823604 RepID=A0A8S5LC13_9CAUD|nr:MAG TPA: hypothetical protein [Siphoviridae sp. ctt5z12]
MTQEKAEAKIREYMGEICERTDKDDIYGGLDSLFEYEDYTDVVLCIREYLIEHPNEKVSETFKELLADLRKIKEKYKARIEATTAQILEPFRVITDEYERIAG